MKQTIQLSKWWRTPSAKAAMKRAKEKQRERFAQLKEKARAKKEALDREIWNES